LSAQNAHRQLSRRLRPLSAVDLGAAVVRGLLERCSLPARRSTN
jgi:hypothetical protein